MNPDPSMTTTEPDEASTENTVGQLKAEADKWAATAKERRDDVQKQRAALEQEYRARAEKSRREAEEAAAEFNSLREQTKQARTTAEPPQRGGDAGSRDAEADRVIKEQWWKAAGVGVAAAPIAGITGVIAAPLLDVVGVTAVQVQMLRRLCRIYGVDYDEQMGKSLIGAIAGAYVPARLGYGGLGLALALIPVVGPILGIATLPGFNAASTYAIGGLFKGHFAKGGTLWTADRASMGAAYATALGR
jgi:uncharacterized protein (DUF697 family)